MRHQTKVPSVACLYFRAVFFPFPDSILTAVDRSLPIGRTEVSADQMRSAKGVGHGRSRGALCGTFLNTFSETPVRKSGSTLPNLAIFRGFFDCRGPSRFCAPMMRIDPVCDSEGRLRGQLAILCWNSADIWAECNTSPSIRSQYLADPGTRTPLCHSRISQRKSFTASRKRSPFRCMCCFPWECWGYIPSRIRGRSTHCRCTWAGWHSRPSCSSATPVASTKPYTRHSVSLLG